LLQYFWEFHFVKEINARSINGTSFTYEQSLPKGFNAKGGKSKICCQRKTKAGGGTVTKRQAKITSKKEEQRLASYA